MNFSTTLLLAGFAGAGALAAAQQTGTPAVQPLPPPDVELEEVVVIGHERRYVAPTTRDRIGRVWVPVHINDQGPFRLVLDSGAVRSAVVPRVAQALGIPLDRAPPVVVKGMTGTAVTPAIDVAQIRVGDLVVGPARMPVVEDAFGGAEGLLGTDGMQDKRIFIDFRNDFINIATSRNRRAALGFAAVPFIEDPTNLLIVDAEVGTLPVRAIIDTGAQSSIGNLALQEALRRQVERGRRGEDEIKGATGDVQIGIGARISPIRIGDLIVRDAHITFGDMHIFETWKIGDRPAVVIGMDILGLLDTLVIDYHRRELHIKPRRES